MNAPTFDENGYPTQETRDAIESWDCNDIPGLLEFCRAALKYPPYWRVKGAYHFVSTGGWSGNEYIIDALRDNTMFWATAWKRSSRGGHYIFEVPEWQVQ